LLFGSSGSSANGQLGKHLPRVGADDVRGITLGKMQAECCFTNTRIPYKDRVILCTTRKNFRSFLNFFITSNNWI